MSMTAPHAEAPSLRSATNPQTTRRFMRGVNAMSMPEPRQPSAPVAGTQEDACAITQALVQPPLDTTGDLASRIRLLIASEGSAAAIARRCGFSTGAVRSWRDGHSDISRERCMILSRRLGISLLWLVAGIGPMKAKVAESIAHSPDAHGSAATVSAAEPRRRDENSPSRPRAPTVDPKQLAAALRLLQSYIGLIGGSLNPNERADVLAELYDILGDAEDPAQIDRLINFHHMLRSHLRQGHSLIA